MFTCYKRRKNVIILVEDLFGVKMLGNNEENGNVNVCIQIYLVVKPVINQLHVKKEIQCKIS